VQSINLLDEEWEFLTDLLPRYGASKRGSLGQRNPTGANKENGERNLCSLLLNSGRDGDADFIFLARDTQTPYVDNRPLAVAGKPEIREYKAVFVQSDAEIGLFSDELVVNCAP